MPSETQASSELPPIPAKRYFTIGEVSDLCLVKPHVLRYCFTIIGARGRLDEEANGGQTVLTRRRGSQGLQASAVKAATDDINLEALRTDLIDIANLLDAG